MAGDCLPQWRRALHGLAAAVPQVVLMEQTLLDGCGLQWAGQLKRRHPQLPVVIHTANGSPEKLFQALMIPAMGYVVKSIKTGWPPRIWGIGGVEGSC